MLALLLAAALANADSPNGTWKSTAEPSRKNAFSAFTSFFLQIVPGQARALEVTGQEWLAETYSTQEPQPGRFVWTSTQSGQSFELTLSAANSALRFCAEDCADYAASNLPALASGVHATPATAIQIKTQVGEESGAAILQPSTLFQNTYDLSRQKLAQITLKQTRFDRHVLRAWVTARLIAGDPASAASYAYAADFEDVDGNLVNAIATASARQPQAGKLTLRVDGERFGDLALELQF